MPIPNGSRVLAIAQRGAKRDIKTAFARVANEVAGILVRSTDNTGIIPFNQKAAVLTAAGDALNRMFIGEQGSPFARDGVTPQSPFALTINTWGVYVTVKNVRLHRDWMKRTIPEDVYTWLRKRGQPARVAEAVNPFLRGELESLLEHKARLDGLRIFRNNPLARYEPMHTWVDPNGYRLSDRIWNVAESTRDKLNKILQDGINQGMSSMRLAKQVEQFLLPGRAALRTKKPYGTDASFDAMRLARTEISHAAAQASYASAFMNPYVGGIDWALSPSHPRVDICDELATIGMSGRLRDPYPVESARLPPAHPHCLCRTQPAVGDDPATVTQQLRAVLQDSQASSYTVVTPAQGDEFILGLLGRALHLWYLLTSAREVFS